MKKFLASLIAVSSLVGFSSAVNAQIATPTWNTTVNGLCTITATNPTTTTVTTLSADATSTAGKIATKCNTTGAKLEVNLDTPVASDTVNGNSQVVARSYELTNGTLAYSAVTLPTGFQNNLAPITATTFTGINHLNSTTASEIDVKAKIAAPAGQYIASGSYITRVTATITP